MAKRRKLKNTRPKALFGEAAAIAAQTIAQVASAAMQAKATYDSARTQADATLNNAKTQADALKQQNDNNTKLQQEMMEFTKAQNDETRQIQKDMQMNMQLLAGGQSTRDRREAAKIVVKYGGSKGKGKRKLRNAASFLRGDNNLPFRVTDGGGVIPIGTTPEGYNIYELYGNDHEHYHKTRGGKNKTGVGVKFIDGTEIEGEGNQNSNNGELMVTTPTDALFISKHSIGGFNPADAVKNGMDPIEAYNAQESIKAMYGITDDGDDNSTPVKRRRPLRAAMGANISLTPLPFTPYGFVTPSATTAAYEISQTNAARNTAKNGTSVKKQINSIKNRRKLASGGNWWLAPTISGAGNILGAGLTSLGTWLGSRFLSKNVRQAGDIMANAYDNLHGIDINSVFDKNTFRAAHYMPVVRSSFYNANPQLEGIRRDSLRQTNAVNNNTLSSAARLSRTNQANILADEARSKVYATKANAEEQIRQQNMQMINEAAAKNAELDTAALKDRTAQMIDVAKFNTNIDNEKVLGKAEAQTDTLNTLGQIGATMRQSIGNAFGSAISQTGLGFANAYNSKLVRDHEMNMALLKADDDGIVRWYSDPANGTDDQAMRQVNRFLDIANSSPDPDVAANARRRANEIIRGRNLKVGTSTDSVVNITQNINTPNSGYGSIAALSNSIYNALGITNPYGGWLE